MSYQRKIKRTGANQSEESPEFGFKDDETKKPWVTPFQLVAANSFCIIFLLIALAAVAAVALSGLSAESDFIAVQHLQASLTAEGNAVSSKSGGKHSHVVQQIDDGTDLYISVCTDVVPSPGKVEFKGRTIIGYNCAEPTNQCAMNSCNSTSGRCQEAPIAGAQCYLDATCGVGSGCNLETCQCQALPNSTVGCTTSDECPDISDRGICSGYVCNVEGVCVETIFEEGVCWSDSQCDSNTEYCDQTICNCVPRSVIQCTQNSDCPDISDRGDCVTNLCTAGVCTETTLGECWFAGQCAGMNETCDPDTCTCVSATAENCFADTDCPDLSDRGDCVENQCIDNTCVEVTLGTCWYDGQCDQPTQFCNQTSCSCALEPVVTCQQNSDCTDISDRGGCVENQCLAGTCVEVTLGTCWYDEQCTTSGEECNLMTCSCEPVITPSCSFDIECPNITDRGMCVSYQCIDNRCVETPTNECWFSDQCGAGEACDTESTCACIPIADTCDSGYDVRALPAPSTLLNLIFGWSITISEEHIVNLAVDDSGGMSNAFVLDLYTRFDSTWVFSSETGTSVTNPSIPGFEAGAVESYETLVAFIGRDSTGAQPQQSSLEIYRILVSNQLSLLQTIPLPLTSEPYVDVCIYEDTIVAVSEDAYIYDLSGVDTWSLTQTINGTEVYIQCSIWDFALVLSNLRDPTGDSYETYSLNAGTWSLLDTGTTTALDGSWGSVVVAINGQTALDDPPFNVFSSALEYPNSILAINTATGTNFETNRFIASTGPGVINGYNRNTIVSDTLMMNTQNVVNFQDRFDGFSVAQNDVWQDDVAFVVNLGANYTAYANFCPRS